MNFLKLLLLLLIVSSTAHAQEVNDLSRQKLAGAVRSVTENESDYKGEGDRFPHRWSSVTTYDKAGNQVKWSYSAEATVSEYSVYTRSADNEVTEKNYNGRGALLKKYVCRYDNKGNPVSETEYNADGKVAGRSFWHYDKHGNETEVSQNTHSVSVSYNCIYAYDANGRMTRMQKTTANSNVPRITLYEYDQSGNRTGETNYAADTIAGKTVFKYDGKNLVETGYYGADKAYHVTAAYTDFDKNGNWTKKKEYRGNGYVVYERSFEYY